MVEVIGGPIVPIAAVDTSGLLTHLDANMVQLLHPEELSHIRLALILVVLQVVDVANSELFELFSEAFDGLTELLHDLHEVAGEAPLTYTSPPCSLPLVMW